MLIDMHGLQSIEAVDLDRQNASHLVFQGEGLDRVVIFMPYRMAAALASTYRAILAEVSLKSVETVTGESANVLHHWCADDLSRQYADQVPRRFRLGLARYFADSVEPGGFLRSVLENDLRKALASTDQPNLSALNHVMGFLTHAAPSIYWGSAERVAEHLSKFVQDEPDQEF